ncbi:MULTISPECIES: D-alanine:D-lactate ligase-like protein [unclassified Mesorhizobium]|uniref:D-alanine:D-lactate ligase-like protein n=1 Tax=unclassified Mesorhizobium TaxID=325217 RepID=UPI000BAEE11D|nr:MULTISPECIES: D-alanine:D-lactate ligase-like protein [unclassified Mesorhizobium]TGT53789.1 D-alanine:D-lactate ligase-like protein [Mesorhizobium sp. M00.F.Ca.ET.170.01.1.1]AZO09787.1 D-alanine:D-lactate ligase-like protein [Mesorhizobium sp. M3A.F.Ca.ET.080.04.2.1]PBB85273.1 D-alanine:D-lactate ligase-like protein [Mesorhizobium sp. WSM3876]RWB67067.1 MAG: D-alanine:D-lactate ligase-like protein [Mesorhizobium sp.]RWB82561.1 MAG: D-alanine:D-lactate ligase-like protein [Mesorhizobium sp.
MMHPQLILVYEPEQACFDRLTSDGFDSNRAAEISAYLAQSTDLAREFGEIEQVCAAYGMSFNPVELVDMEVRLAAADPQTALVWTLTDGIAYFRGGAAPALARLRGLKTIGADDSLFALCQDKFRSGSVLSSLGMPVPAAGLARAGEWLVEPPASQKGWFVKPNRLGAKIGIWPDSHCSNLAQALEISRRIFAAYRDDTVVQAYVSGRNVRASFLGIEPGAGAEALGIAFVDSAGDFLTMAESLALYGDAGETAKTVGAYQEPILMSVDASQPVADARVRAIADRLMRVLGLRDVFSMDLRIEPDDTVHLIEFEVAPGLPSFDFRSYCRSQWKLSLAEALAATAARRLCKGQDP